MFWEDWRMTFVRIVLGERRTEPAVIQLDLGPAING